MGAEAYPPGGVADVSQDEDGFYAKLALPSSSSDSIVAREEAFGWSPALMAFKDEEEGMSLVNCSRYGLWNSMWTKDLDRATRLADGQLMD